jgi:hypothetical protein
MCIGTTFVLQQGIMKETSTSKDEFFCLKVGERQSRYDMALPQQQNIIIYVVSAATVKGK